ncbi:MAG: glycosyltransferase family 39 protein [Deltaproteobacteria bacterium]|nr:glycosyltransferase family 39 protein [Deltaproteobacteria bacterium]MBW1977317.1 glycosyltransferase family 39 protein [Deltaproteobacteria bacterium]MBW2046223.1 glycosyltransferase family 39 protein [Deltaproteobacteria bacterium]MBW2300191.1 glycosyltransferase family 39 protein [Deltaproteobacteria bacterium]
MTLFSKSPQAIPSNLPNGGALIEVMPLILIILVGLGMRLFAAAYVSIINPDGTLYIHQARALWYGQWSELTSCGVRYVSAYPLLIAGVHCIIKDWVLAARSVSVIFGTLTLLPVYILLRRFLKSNVSILGALAFALIPVLVTRSADVVRGPMAWFLGAVGLYLFVLHVDLFKRWHLPLSSLCYLIAAWCRIEFILFFFVSLLYLVLIEKEKKLENFLGFIGPCLIIILILLFGLKFLNTSVGDAYRLQEMAHKFSNSITAYKDLKANLSILMNQSMMTEIKLFLQRARHLVWFIALGTFFIYAMKAFFYPFFFIFLLGVPGIGRKIKKDRGLLYLTLISLFAFFLLYFHILQTWVIGGRFLVLFMLPSFVILGFGLDNMIRFLTGRLNWSSKVAFSIICIFLLGFGLPKNLKHRETDKVVFKEIGELIAQREGNNEVIQVASSLDILRWISFYANLGYQGAPCPQPYGDFKAIVGNSYKDFVQNLKKRRIKYFVWEEKHWPTGTFDFMREMRLKDFQALGTWSHPDTGRMILFKAT